MKIRLFQELSALNEEFGHVILGGKLERLLAQGEDIEEKVDVLCPSRFLNGELHGPGGGQDEVICGGPESLEAFETVGELRFGNHAAVQRAAITFSSR
jgi:hypothetical protein